jgi:hypothetical protein
MSRQAVKRKGRQFTIDVLEFRRQQIAGTLTPEDRAFVDRHLPGISDIQIPGVLKVKDGKCSTRGERPEQVHAQTSAEVAKL